MTWICANCGAEHGSNDPPCRECAGERFVEAGAGEEGTVETTFVRFVCESCGRVHQRNTPPCSNCGAMGFRTVRDPEELPGPEAGGDDPFSGSPVSRRELLVGGGVAAAGIGVIWLSNQGDGGGTGARPTAGLSPEAVATEFVRALEAGDLDRVNELTHPAGPNADERVVDAGPIGAPRTEGTTVQSASVVREDDGAAVVRVEFSIEVSDAPAVEGEARYELRTRDGAWLVWETVEPPRLDGAGIPR